MNPSACDGGPGLAETEVLKLVAGNRHTLGMESPGRQEDGEKRGKFDGSGHGVNRVSGFMDQGDRYSTEGIECKARRGWVLGDGIGIGD